MRRTLIAFAMLLISASAHGQDASAENQAAATSLFNEGKALMNDGKLDEACNKFVLSLKYDKRIGTTLNLADCYERGGKIASAWARFLEAQSLAQRANQPERVEFAKQHADALVAKIPHVMIAALSKPEGLEVLRDGVLLDTQALGQAVPIDPGKHVLSARAPLKMPWQREIDIGTEPKETDIIIPALQDDPVAIARAKADKERMGSEVFWTGQRIVGLTSAIVGVAGVAVGSVFGLVASSQWSDASGPNHCDSTGCDLTGVNEGKNASTSATISTIAFIAGGVLVGTGAVLFLTGGHKSKEGKTAIFFTPSIGGGVLGGRF